MIQAASLFNQLLQHFPRLEFAALVRKHEAERGAKGSGLLDATGSDAVLPDGACGFFAREICNGLACSMNWFTSESAWRRINPRWLTPTSIVLRSCMRSCSIRSWHASAMRRTGVRKQRIRFKNKLLSLDSTTISLCLEMFPWAKFRRAKGGVKAHVLLDHDDYLPRYVLITEARRNDVKMADAFPSTPVRSSSWIAVTTTTACSENGLTRESISSRA